MNRQIRRRVAKLVRRQQKKGVMPRKNDPMLQSLKVLNNLFNLDNFTAPPELQRPLSWKLSNEKAFFESICMNRISGEIIIVDVQKALDSLEYEVASKNNIAYDLVHKAIKLFKDCLDRGQEYVILDGHNRLVFYMNLLNDKWSIPSGEYEYVREMHDSEPSKFVVTDNANKFSDLSKKAQNSILSRLQIITEYTQIDWIGMSLVFINTNSMVAPNAQEIRNASVSQWADYVRKIRKNNINLLRMMFENPLNRLSGDEWIVDCLDFVTQAVKVSENPVTFERQINQGRVDADGKSIAESYTTNVICKGITQTTKFNLYDFELSPNSDYYEAIFESLEDWVSKMINKASTPEEKKYLKTKSLLQNLFYMMCNGIETYDDAVEAVKLHFEAWNDGSITYGPDQATFRNACSGSSMANIEFRYIILSRIVDTVNLKSLDSLKFNEEFKLETA